MSPETRCNGLLWLGALALLPAVALLVRTLTALFGPDGGAEPTLAPDPITLAIALLACPALSLLSGSRATRWRPLAGRCMMISAILLVGANFALHKLG